VNVDPNQTLRKWARAYRDAYLVDDLGVSKAEYDRHYPPESRKEQWLGYLWHYIRFGGVLRPETCDSVCREFERGEVILDQIRHDYEACIPTGYRKPSVRKSNANHEREWVEARRRGREHGGSA
jgi:hypothetical protein